MQYSMLEKSEMNKDMSLFRESILECEYARIHNSSPSTTSKMSGSRTSANFHGRICQVEGSGLLAVAQSKSLPSFFKILKAHITPPNQDSKKNFKNPSQI